jgi:hypothetical protein
MSLELPRVTLAEGVAAALCAVCAAVTELALGRRTGAPPGTGLLAGAALAVWLGAAVMRPGRVLRKVVWLTDGGWQLEFRDGVTAAARLGPGTRILGRTLVLQWRTSDRTVARWLTPWDVDEAGLRALMVRLACAARFRAS